MNYLITVLIPTYNNYNSFLNLFKAYISDIRVKIIVSDDSNDISEKNAIKRKCFEEGIIYLEGPKLLPVENWNFLMERIDTPFFVMNHHDEYPLNLSFLDLLDPKEIGLIILPCTSFSKGKSYHKIYSWQQNLLSRIFFIAPNASFNIFLAPTASLILNSKFKDILFDKNLKWFVDADWYCRIYLRLRRDELKIKFCNTTRIISIQAKNSITSSIGKKLKDQIKIEKPYLNKKGLIPNKFISTLQLFCLVSIIFISKIKQYFHCIFSL